MNKKIAIVSASSLLALMAIVTVIYALTIDPVSVKPPAPELISESSSTSINTYLAVSVIVLAVVAGGAVIISFYLYRWRKVLLANPHMTIPEEFGSWVSGLQKDIQNSNQLVTEAYSRTEGRFSDTDQNVKGLLESFLALQASLDAKDREIARLKSGYDQQIYKKFLTRFIRVAQAAEDILHSETSGIEDLKHIIILLEDALDECGVEAFSPEIGEDYRTAFGVADHPKVAPVTQPGDEFKIFEVEEKGFKVKKEDGYEAIVKAKVRIYAEN